MYGYYSSMILLIPAILLSIYAQSKVQGAYRTYLNVRNARGITGAEAASRILQFNDLQIPINEIEGTLTDNYNPQQGTMNLSAQVYELPTIASMAIAAHECGHALQHASGYSLLNLRNSIVPVANVGSMLSWPLLLIGLMMGQSGGFLFNLGIFMFLGVVLFHTMFIVAPRAGAYITGDSMIGEYFRVFVSYAVITVALIMYETNKRKAKSAEAMKLMAAQEEEDGGKEQA